jgi:ribonuclease HIII
LAQVKRDGAMKIAAVENEMKKKLEDQTELEKVIKVLENEKAVMAASIEARDSKLQKMASLQDTVDLLSAQSKKYESVRAQLVRMSMLLL